MGKKQLITLFIGCLLIWTLAQGSLALLPVYAVRLGADPGLIGDYLALAFLALTMGTVAAGWLSDKFQSRKLLLVLTGVINVPATWLMGQATAFWQLAVLTAIVWFCFGVGFTIINILAGLFAGEAERGKIFGILATNTSLGALIGGSVSGPLVDHYGYQGLFVVAALCWAFEPVIIALFLQDKVVSRAPQKAATTLPTKPVLGGAFNLLLVATMIAFAAGFVAVLGKPLLMDQLGFDSSQISGAVAIGGAVSLPFPLLLGWLSDRVGRYGLVVLCFLTGAVGLIVLAGSVSLWHFWAASILLAGTGVSLGVASALVTDLVRPEALGLALSRYGASPTIGAIVGLLLTGYAIQSLGMTATFIAGALLTLLAVALLVPVQRNQVRRLANN